MMVQGKNQKPYIFRRQYDQETERLLSHEKGEVQIPYQSSIIFRRKD